MKGYVLFEGEITNIDLKKKIIRWSNTVEILVCKEKSFKNLFVKNHFARKAAICVDRSIVRKIMIHCPQEYGDPVGG